MSTLRTRIVAGVQSYLTKTAGTAHPPIAEDVLSRSVSPVLATVIYDWADGTSSGQASKRHSREILLPNNTTLTTNLDNVSDEFGDPVNFGKVKLVFVEVVEGPGTLYWHDTFNPFTPSPAQDMEAKLLAAGDVVLIARPAGITISGSNKAITFGAVGGNVTVRLVIIGDAA